MRLGADHDKRWRHRLLCSVALAALTTAACTRSWMLGPESDAGTGGMTGAMAGAGGGPPIPGTGGFPGFGGRGDSGSGGRSPSCMNPSFPPTSMVTADVVFVVSRNQSMKTPFGDMTRMTAVQAAVYQIAQANEKAIRFGYEDFPAIEGCSDGSMCCPSSKYHTPALPMNAGSVNAGLNHCDQSGPGTGCVADSDSRALSQTLGDVADLFNPPDDHYLVLIMDGPPGCPGEDPTTACNKAQAGETPLTSMGYKTYVIELGDQAQSDFCLNQLAHLGGTGTQLLSADDPQSLGVALSKAMSVPLSTPCTVQLLGKISDPSLISVFVGPDRTEVHYDQSGSDGWSWVNGNGRINLQGKACAAAQAHPGITVRYGCPPCTTPSAACL